MSNNSPLPPPHHNYLPPPASATPLRVTQSAPAFLTPQGAFPSVFAQPSSAPYDPAIDDWVDGVRRKPEVTREQMEEYSARKEAEQRERLVDERERDVQLVTALNQLLLTHKRSLGDLLLLTFEPEIKGGPSHTGHLTHFLRPTEKTSVAAEVVRRIRDHPLNLDSIQSKSHKGRRSAADTGPPAPTLVPTTPSEPSRVEPHLPSATFVAPSPSPVVSGAATSPPDTNLPPTGFVPPRAIQRVAPLTSAQVRIDDLAVSMTIEQIQKEQKDRWNKKSNSIGTAAQWNIGYFADFSLSSELESWRASALFRILSGATRGLRDKADGPEPDGSKRARDLVCVVFCLATLYLFKNTLGGFQALMSLLLFSTGSPTAIYTIFNRLGLCLAYSTTLTGLVAHGNSSLAALALRVQAGTLHLTTFDNINSDKKVWEGNQRTGKSTAHQDGVAAYVAELDLGTPERTRAALDRKLWDKQRDAHRVAGTGRAALTAKVIEDSLDERHQRGCAVIQLLDILCDIVPALARLKPRIRGLYAQMGLEKSVSAPKKTVMTSLRTSAFNEAKTAEHANIVVNLLTQQGMSEEKAREWIRPFTGDWLSIDRLRKMILQKSHETPEFDFSHILPVIALWHMRWSEVKSIVKTNWGGGVDDAFSLATAARLAKININVNDVNFKAGHNLIMLEVGVLSALYWKSTMDAVAKRDERPNCATLADYFSPSYGREWSISDLVTIATGIVERRWVSEQAQTMELDPDAADQTVRAAHIFFRRAIRYREFSLAVSMGDGGRCYEVIKSWIFTFAGAIPRCSNYSAETLDLFCQFEYELPPLLRELIEKEIFTINPSGRLDGRKEPDVALETIIREIKIGAGATKVTGYGEKHYTHVVSPNSIAMGDSRRGYRDQFELAPKSGRHGILCDNSKFTSLYDHHNTGRVQWTIAGRTQDHLPRDDEAEGHEVLQSLKGVASFVARTVRNPLRVSEPTEGLSQEEMDARERASREEMGDRNNRGGPVRGGPELESDDEDELE
ncbi:hypothetical protein P7C70_g2775, partial [Phenoliferia sp. Uapishka_3]